MHGEKEGQKDQGPGTAHDSECEPAWASSSRRSRGPTSSAMAAMDTLAIHTIAQPQADGSHVFLFFGDPSAQPNNGDALVMQHLQAGRRAVYEPLAHAFEKPTPSNETEYRRKVRMFEHCWEVTSRCEDGPDRYGFCCEVQLNKVRVIKTRYSDYPW